MRVRERGQTWIRTDKREPKAVAVWVCLGRDKMLCIREDGSHFVTADAKSYVLEQENDYDPRIDRIA